MRLEACVSLVLIVCDDPAAYCSLHSDDRSPWRFLTWVVKGVTSRPSE